MLPIVAGAVWRAADVGDPAQWTYEDLDDPARRRHLLRLWLRAHDLTAVEDVLQGGIPTRSIRGSLSL